MTGATDSSPKQGGAAPTWLRLTPRAGADRIDGVDSAGELRARVRAVPADGAPNDALRRLLADELDLALGDVTIERGHSASRKVVALDRVSVESHSDRWPGLRVG